MFSIEKTVTPAPTLWSLQDDWDTEARRAKIAALRATIHSDGDRWTARFSYGAAIAACLPLAAHMLLFVLRGAA